MMGVTVRLVGLLAAALVVTGCSSSEPDPAPTRSTAVTATTTQAAGVVADQAEQNTTAVRLCEDLDRLGAKFYSELYKPLVLDSQTQISATPIEVTAYVAVLSTIGAEDGEIDGQATIVEATPAIRDVMLTVVRDASRVGQHYATSAKTGAAVDTSMLQPLFTSVPTAAVACRNIGSEPSWF